MRVIRYDMVRMEPTTPRERVRQRVQEKALTIEGRRDAWIASLRTIRSAPLELIPDFPEVARRWIDWWAFNADRPLIVGQTVQDRNWRWDKAFDLLDKPFEWLEVRRGQVERTRHAGESLPFVRVDIGPVAMGPFLGAPLHLAEKEQTSWQTPTIESWDEEPLLKADPANEWLVKVLSLMELLAEDARGRYLVCLPDLTGALDLLANMRSTEKLCFDLWEHRGEVLRAAQRAVDAWEDVFVRMYDLVLSKGAGITQWVSCWADSPFTVPTCDFNALIGPDDFREVCMPSLKEQARRAGLCVFHLDGPDAARHAEILADDPDITAVQFTPGAGTPSALAQLPLLKMIQERRVPLFIETEYHEVKELAQELDPRGTAIRVRELEGPKQADELIAWRDRTFA